MRRPLYIDYEFNRILHPQVNLVCAATYDPVKKEKLKWWLHNDQREQNRLMMYLSKFDLIIGYSAIAECRSFMALGLEPLDFQWLDLFVEYRMLTNHNDRLQWGKQLVDGRVKMTFKPKPKWERTEEDAATGFKATHSLAEATYKLTGKVRDTKHKTAMRDLIISDPEEFSEAEKIAIMDYCLEDVIFLPTIRRRIKEEFIAVVNPRDEKKALAEYAREAIARGRYSAHTAHMEARGYPIDVKATRNFAKQVGNIIFDVQREISDNFPDVKPFKWDKKNNRMRWDQIATKAWIRENHDEKKWKKTDGKDLSLALEAFEKFYDFKHHYPVDNLGAQFVRLLKLKQSLYGFGPAQKGKRNFWDYFGPDERVRPYMNIFGAQSSRSQPAATGFMFLKPAWMRALVQPAEGHFMAGIDYGQQEFLIAALYARDKNMINAYLSGDPYLEFGKISKQIPPDGTKESHKTQRDLCKNTTLGISYLMTKYGLAIKLTNDTGRQWNEDEAQEQIDIFYEAFEDLGLSQEEVKERYVEDGFIKLPLDGWYMFGDNDNIRSVVNVPVQGAGAACMRKAVDVNHARGGASAAFTLHDAIYIEGRCGEERKILTLRDAMRDAFCELFPSDQRDIARQIKLDPFIWGPSYKRDSEILIGKEKYRVPCSDLYIDDRSIVDWNKFSGYFKHRLEDDL